VTHGITNNKQDEEDPIAAWEALLLPEWRWEALDKTEDDRYYGRVKSPMTYGNWEYGYFTQEQLEEAGAYRVDENIDSGEPLFPDGGYQALAEVYKTELGVPAQYPSALLESPAESMRQSAYRVRSTLVRKDNRV